jgi:hypothetical protein
MQPEKFDFQKILKECSSPEDFEDLLDYVDNIPEPEEREKLVVQIKERLAILFHENHFLDADSNEKKNNKKYTVFLPEVSLAIN